MPNIWSIIQANNIYVYCGNSSVMFVDPFGLRGWFQPGGYDPYEADPSQTPPLLGAVENSIVELDWFSKTTTNPITIEETDSHIYVYTYLYIDGKFADNEELMAPPNAEGKETISYREAIMSGILDYWNGTYKEKDVVLNLVDLNDGNSYFIQNEQRYVTINFENILGTSCVMYNDTYSPENPGTMYLFKRDEQKHSDHFRTSDTINCCVYNYYDFSMVAAHEYGHVLGIGDLYDDEDLASKYPESLKTPSIMGNIWQHRCVAQEIDYAMMFRAHNTEGLVTWYNNRDLLNLPTS